MSSFQDLKTEAQSTVLFGNADVDKLKTNSYCRELLRKVSTVGRNVPFFSVAKSSSEEDPLYFYFTFWNHCAV